jgi:putative transposase
VLLVSRSGYYKWLTGKVSKREQREEQVTAQIRRVFDESNQTYGSPRVEKQLRREGIVCNHKLVEKIMHKNGLRPKRRRKFRNTTDSKHALPVSENLLQRQFDQLKANAVWAGDITYIETQEGWLYLSVFIDLQSRRVVGWSMSERLTADIAVAAFDMGTQRYGMPELVHSDRGVQYASMDFRNRLKKCKQSMSRKGNCWDNAIAESFFSTLKCELVHRKTYRSRKEAEMDVFAYIEIFYNKQRLHSALGYLTPEEKGQKGGIAA